jgi:hypothetical protein
MPASSAALAAALDFDRQRLVGRQQRVVLNLLPVVVLYAVEGDDAVARLYARALGRAVRRDGLDDGRRHHRHADHHREREGHGERRDDVHHRARDADAELLPARAKVEALARGDLFLSPLFDSRVRVVAAELDVAAERYEREAVVGRSPTSAPYALAEADREGLDANPQQLRDDEMAELVQNNRRAEDEYEGENPSHRAKDFLLSDRAARV